MGWIEDRMYGVGGGLPPAEGSAERAVRAQNFMTSWSGVQGA